MESDDVAEDVVGHEVVDRAGGDGLETLLGVDHQVGEVSVGVGHHVSFVLVAHGLLSLVSRVSLRVCHRGEHHHAILEQILNPLVKGIVLQKQYYTLQTTIWPHSLVPVQRST